jgi:hypothetical protein
MVDGVLLTLVSYGVIVLFVTWFAANIIANLDESLYKLDKHRHEDTGDVEKTDVLPVPPPPTHGASVQNRR